MLEIPQVEFMNNRFFSSIREYEMVPIYSIIIVKCRSWNILFHNFDTYEREDETHFFRAFWVKYLVLKLNLLSDYYIKEQYHVCWLQPLIQSSAPVEYALGEAEFYTASKATFAIWHWYPYHLVHVQPVKTKNLFGIWNVSCRTTGYETEKKKKKGTEEQTITFKSSLRHTLQLQLPRQNGHAIAISSLVFSGYLFYLFFKTIGWEPCYIGKEIQLKFTKNVPSL